MIGCGGGITFIRLGIGFCARVGVFRGNEIWREVRSKGQGSEVLENELLYRNWVVVKYEVGESLLVVNG